LCWHNSHKTLKNTLCYFLPAPYFIRAYVGKPDPLKAALIAPRSAGRDFVHGRIGVIQQRDGGRRAFVAFVLDAVPSLTTLLLAMVQFVTLASPAA
jgi:hypothetical protein